MAKQAALVDLLSGGRFRLGIGVGWNEVEFIGLNKNFRNRGKRSPEQVRVMQALWAEPHVRFGGEFHHIDDAGIKPRPASGACRSGMAGTPKRLSGAVHNMATDTCRSLIPRARPHSPRSPNCGHRRARPGETRQRWGLKFGSPPAPAPEQDWRRETTFWKEAGVTHITAHTSCVSGHRKRIPGRGFVDHLTAITRYREAVADLLWLHRLRADYSGRRVDCQATICQRPPLLA